ncbi:MAG TPA: transporter [Xanthobacteraceae bacterium]|jgi:hypothetical protein
MYRSSLNRFLLAIAALISAPAIAGADEGGVSFWIPGFFGSLAAVPQQPGWSLTSIYYHTSVSAAGDVAIARERTLGSIPINVMLSAGLNANVNAQGDLGLAVLSYVSPTPILGGQASFSLLGLYGRMSTSLAAQLSGTVSASVGGAPIGSIPFSRSDSISDALWGFGDLLPQFALRWNAGVNNYMVYVTGDVPVGAYDPSRLSNIGIGHGTVDAGFGYTYFNQKTGHELSGVLGFTYNMSNQQTQYQNGVDLHFDWGASQFLTKQFQVGVVGYVYDEVGCDSGSGDRVGCFRSRVVGVGPQVGFIIPISSTTQGYLNLKGYKEFDNANRPDGWNAWVTFVLSPAQQTPSSATRRMRSM